MSDESDDPVMQLLATQRAVLGAVENLANQVEAMQAKVDAMSGVLAQLVAGSVGAAVPATKGGTDRGMTVGDRFRAATPDEAAADPELAAAQAQVMAMEELARVQFPDRPHMPEMVRRAGREQIARLLDKGDTIMASVPDKGRER
ncbi:hypothetical protein [Sphingobium sp. ZW T5_29]|uniref:hypothetical protein n=1 Tax=Sphingobium sp. ZW T5_29 TaxID=3378077 RepID=UPI0038536F6E